MSDPRATGLRPAKMKGTWRVSLLLSAAWVALAGPAPARAALEERWVQAGGGGEWTRHADEDPYFFHNTEGWTRTAHASAGAGSRWLVAVSASDQRLKQDWWSYRGIRRSAWMAKALTPQVGLEAFGMGTSGWMRWPDPAGIRREGATGWSWGGGLTWCPRPEEDAPVLVNARLRLTRPADAAGPERRITSAELNLARLGTGGSQRLGVLVSRENGRNQGAMLARATKRLGRLQLRADGLAGHQVEWLDVERLVLHDGARGLRGMATGGVSWDLWHGLALEGSAGWEKVEGHESRWLYLGGRWTWRTWSVRP